MGTRAGLWIRLLGLGALAAPSRASLLESPRLGRPGPGPGQWVGGQVYSAAGPVAGAATSSPWDPQPLSLAGPPGAVRAHLKLHVHGADVACLVLSDPQLPVFGWIHFSKQLVHRLNCLQGTEKGSQSEPAAMPGTAKTPARFGGAQGCGEPRGSRPHAASRSLHSALGPRACMTRQGAPGLQVRDHPLHLSPPEHPRTGPMEP